MEDRICLPNVASDTYYRREMVELKFRALKPDDVLGWVTGPEPGDFEFNPEIFPPTHRKIEYRREAPGSDWFVRVEPRDGYHWPDLPR